RILGEHCCLGRSRLLLATMHPTPSITRGRVMSVPRRASAMVVVIFVLFLALCWHVPVHGDDASKPGKGKVLCLYEEVKGTDLEFLEVDGKPSKPRTIAEENDLRLAIPKAILGRLAEISSEKDVSGLEELRFGLVRATASEEQAVSLSGASKFQLK